jgi:uracil-DNA glycosylase family 4
MSVDLMKVYKVLRSDEQECFNNPLHAADFPCRTTKPKKKGEPDRTDFACQGPGVPGYFVPGQCQILFVALAPTKKEVESTARVRAPFIDVYGQAFNEILKLSEMSGDSRVGLTTLVKCALNHKRTVKAVMSSCSSLFEDELALVRPSIIVPLGDAVAKLLVPEVFFPYTQVFSKDDEKLSLTDPKVAGVSYEHELDGTFYTAIDRTYFFMRDPVDLFGKGGTIKEAELAYVKYGLPGKLAELRAMLVPDDEWLVNRHRDRLSS